MLTPIDVQSKTFKNGLGYDKKDVDSYFAEMAKSFETLYKENVDLNEKVKQLNTGLSQYKAIEKSLQKALILAQKAADDVQEAAKVKAKVIEEEAHNKARIIVSDANSQLEHLHNKILTLLNQYDIYKAQYKHLAKVQLEVLESDSFNLNLANLATFSETVSKSEPEMPEEVRKQLAEAATSIEDNVEEDEEYFTILSDELRPDDI